MNTIKKVTVISYWNHGLKVSLTGVGEVVNVALVGSVPQIFSVEPNGMASADIELLDRMKIQIGEIKGLRTCNMMAYVDERCEVEWCTLESSCNFLSDELQVVVCDSGSGGCGPLEVHHVHHEL